jgi:DNA-binding NtrC family response regulator
VPAPIVLVVEDEEMVGEVVRAMLQVGGYRSVLVDDPRKAVELLEDGDQHFDLLLTDFRMPRMNGMELIQRCHELRPHLPAILYSGDLDERKALGYSVQPRRFMRKPFTPQIINETIKAVLEEE